MEGQASFKEVFSHFEGDVQGWGFWVWLSLHFKTGERVPVSIKELSRNTGYTPRTIMKILSRLEKMHLVTKKIVPQAGVWLELKDSILKLNDTNLELIGTNNHETNPKLASFSSSLEQKNTTLVLKSKLLTSTLPQDKNSSSVSSYFSPGLTESRNKASDIVSSY
jgi:DNA-binding transcriptional ArsR family regulator